MGNNIAWIEIIPAAESDFQFVLDCSYMWEYMNTGNLQLITGHKNKTQGVFCQSY